MKKTVSKDVCEKAKSLYVAIQNRKAAEKLEKELKTFFKEEFPCGVIAGDIVITVKTCTRTIVDKDQLILDLGDKAEKYMNETSYDQLDVQKAV